MIKIVRLLVFLMATRKIFNPLGSGHGVISPKGAGQTLSNWLRFSSMFNWWFYHQSNKIERRLEKENGNNKQRIGSVYWNYEILQI